MADVLVPDPHVTSWDLHGVTRVDGLTQIRMH